jgi:hypothetical protein
MEALQSVERATLIKNLINTSTKTLKGNVIIAVGHNNKTLHPTAIPLRFIAAGELIRYVQHPTTVFKEII